MATTAPRFTERLTESWLGRMVRQAFTPAHTLSLAFLTLGGFLAGVFFWGGFNTVLEATNTEKFCVSCHEMKTNVFEELKGTIHYANRSGVRATCPDCHVPHEWTNKIARKMQASKEVWGHIFGSIDTREKFLALRKHLAEREWERMKANDSLECRNCHSTESMDLSKQNPRAAAAHEKFLFTGERTCIDCHKGIAHRLPNMSGVRDGNDRRPLASLSRRVGHLCLGIGDPPTCSPARSGNALSSAHPRALLASRA